MKANDLVIKMTTGALYKVHAFMYAMDRVEIQRVKPNNFLGPIITVNRDEVTPAKPYDNAHDVKIGDVCHYVGIIAVWRGLLFNVVSAGAMVQVINPHFGAPVDIPYDRLAPIPHHKPNSIFAGVTHVIPPPPQPMPNSAPPPHAVVRCTHEPTGSGFPGGKTWCKLCDRDLVWGNNEWSVVTL